jgi:alginate O-acetyltransferase complex protein AlgI
VLFNSLEFLVFLPAALALYFALPARFRWVFLLVASFYFYMCWKVSYVYLLVASTVLDFVCSRQIARSDQPTVRRRYLFASLFGNLGLLFTYKYYDFLNGSLRALFTAAGFSYPLPDLNLTLPVGISFYTFQTLGYTIDVYRGAIKPEPNLFRFALYVTYFPQLVAGPIERAKNLLPQLRAHFTFDYARVRNGLALVLWGLVKKVVIADRLAEYTGVVFSQPSAYHGLQIWLADYLFVIQLYCDFSGYTDIALGTAGAMGVRLMENFRQPLFSTSIADLWTRWHISLTTWFRDYLYVYVGGRRSRSRMMLGIIIVFLANGLWHGANWTFFLFGLLHGVALVGYYLLRPALNRFYKWTTLDRRPALAFVLANQLVVAIFMFGGNFFRAECVTDSWILIRNLFDFGETGPLNLFAHPSDAWISLVAIVVLYGVEIIGERTGHGPWLAARPSWFRWLLALAGVLAIVLLGKWDAINFLYFQF